MVAYSSDKPTFSPIPTEASATSTVSVKDGTNWEWDVHKIYLEMSKKMKNV